MKKRPNKWYKCETQCTPYTLKGVGWGVGGGGGCQSDTRQKAAFPQTQKQHDGLYMYIAATFSCHAKRGWEPGGMGLKGYQAYVPNHHALRVLQLSSL